MKSKIKEINRRLLKFLGKPDKADIPPNPVELIIATILSQNTNDNNSYKAFNQLREYFPQWEKIKNAKLSTIERLIKPAGLNKQKAKAIKNFVNELIKSNGKAELNFDDKSNDEILSYLTSFNGIGVKTASCVLLFSLQRDVCPVDTHVFRIVNRLGLVNSKNRDSTFWELNKYMPKGVAHSFHTNLIRLGRAICKPANPNCSVCPLEDICAYENKNYEQKSSDLKFRDFMLLDNVN